jgi:hypothetical protein
MVDGRDWTLDVGQGWTVGAFAAGGCFGQAVVLLGLPGKARVDDLAPAVLAAVAQM